MPTTDHGFDVRLEWGLEGVEALGQRATVLVVVDVLSFSTSVDVALSTGSTVFPFRWRDDSAEAFATEQGAVLAHRRGEGPYSLSPASLQSLPPDSRLVLPSPNGSTLALAARHHAEVVAGCLRNAAAVARYCAARAGTIAIIPAGERWPMGRLRPAVEDLLGAGAIAAHLAAARCSPEAEVAIAAIDGVRHRLGETLLACVSGEELVAAGYEADVAIAAELDVSHTVPILRDDRFVAWHPADG